MSATYTLEGIFDDLRGSQVRRSYRIEFVSRCQGGNDVDRIFDSLEPSSRAEGKPGYLTAACSDEQDGQRRSSRAVAGVGGGRAAVGGVARRGKPERLRRAWALRCA